MVTIGQVPAMAAQLDGKGVTVPDMAGLAQKDEALRSHVRIADRPERLYGTRIGAGEAQLVLGCDPIVTVGDETLSRARTGFTRAIVDAEVPATGEFVRAAAAEALAGDAARTADLLPELATLLERIAGGVGEDPLEAAEVGRLAVRLPDDPIATNTLLSGSAFQRGLVLRSAAAIERAIELDGAAVATNRRAFAIGRLVARDPTGPKRLLPEETVGESRWLSANLQELVARRVAHLEAYRDLAYAERYRTLVERVQPAGGRWHPAARRSARRPPAACTRSWLTRANTSSPGSAWPRGASARPRSPSCRRRASARRSCSRPCAPGRNRRRRPTSAGRRSPCSRVEGRSPAARSLPSSARQRSQPFPLSARQR